MGMLVGHLVSYVFYDKWAAGSYKNTGQMK
jgi:hypothetical protein